jgi:hypothetical protein
MVALITGPSLTLQSALAQSPNDPAARYHGMKPTAEGMFLDGLVARPVGLASTILGTGLFVVTLPFSIMGGNVEQARERFIDEPMAYTFRRCLGCFKGEHRSRMRP